MVRSATRAGVSLVTVLTMALAGAAGYAWADAADVVPGVLTADPPPVPPSVPPEPVVPAPGAADVTAAAAQVTGVLDPAAPSAVDAAALTAAVTPLLADPALGPDPTLSIRDLVTGQEMLSQGSGTAVEPASSAKLVTAAAALQVLGAEHRTSTVVGWVPAAERPSGVPALVLVGGGDLLLAAGEGDPDGTVGRVGLLDLARQAVAAATEGDAPLLGPDVTRLDLLVDDSLLGVPQQLGRGDDGTLYAATPASLAVDAGRLEGVTARDAAPAATAGAGFARALQQVLTEAGGPAAPVVAQARVSTTAVPVGTVLTQGLSAPLTDVLAYLLVTSDNTVADGVAGLVAAARQQPTTLVSAGRAVVDAVEQDVGVDLGPTVLADGSGLSAGSVTAAGALTALLATSASRPAADDLSQLSGLLPVAGVEGTLGQRFTAADRSADGRGVVRAKTGTLTGTNALAGVATTGSGRGVAFALLSDGVPAGGTVTSRAASDRVAAAVASCC